MGFPGPSGAELRLKAESPQSQSRTPSVVTQLPLPHCPAALPGGGGKAPFALAGPAWSLSALPSTFGYTCHGQ